MILVFRLEWCLICTRLNPGRVAVQWLPHFCTAQCCTRLALRSAHTQVLCGNRKVLLTPSTSTLRPEWLLLFCPKLAVFSNNTHVPPDDQHFWKNYILFLHRGRRQSSLVVVRLCSNPKEDHACCALMAGLSAGASVRQRNAQPSILCSLACAHSVKCDLALMIFHCGQFYEAPQDV